jgi:hypothetical protein
MGDETCVNQRNSYRIADIKIDGDQHIIY